jgi:YHS domain-containing protein
MPRTVLVLILLLAVFLVGGLSAFGQEPCEKCRAAKDPGAIKCPVMGSNISQEVFVDYRGGKVYFCCPGCIPKFQENTAKFQAKANQQLVLTGQAKQVKCPLTGAKVNPQTKTSISGIDVCFCCGGCQAKVKKAIADKQVEMVFGKGFDKGFAVKTQKETKDK